MIICGLLSILCAISAGVLSRLVLTSSDLSPFQSTEIRLISSVFFLLPISGINILSLVGRIKNRNKLKLFIATVLGTNLGILFQQIVYANLPIGLGWTLLSTSTIFSLLFSSSEGDKISKRSIYLAFITFLGLALALL